ASSIRIPFIYPILAYLPFSTKRRYGVMVLPIGGSRGPPHRTHWRSSYVPDAHSTVVSRRPPGAPRAYDGRTRRRRTARFPDHSDQRNLGGPRPNAELRLPGLVP